MVPLYKKKAFLSLLCCFGHGCVRIQTSRPVHAGGHARCRYHPVVLNSACLSTFLFCFFLVCVCVSLVQAIVLQNGCYYRRLRHGNFEWPPLALLIQRQSSFAAHRKPIAMSIQTQIEWKS